AVRDALDTMLEMWSKYLADRFAGKAPPRPQLPLIPLGVDQNAIEAQADRPHIRAKVRSEMGLGAHDVLVLWVGRLSFFEKAFPQPMLRTAEEAKRVTGAKVHFAMVGWFPTGAHGLRQYAEAARTYAPSVKVHIINGNDATAVGKMWAAADIFLSLVDNIQETFGITPVEAMAAGLPVVASDWDGYRFTIADGTTGFLVPTMGPPPGEGSLIC